MKRNYNSIGIYSQSSGNVAKGAIETTLQDALSGHRTNVLHINSTPDDMESWFKHIKEMIQVNFAGEVATEVNLDNYTSEYALHRTCPDATRNAAMVVNRPQGSGAIAKEWDDKSKQIIAQWGADRSTYLNEVSRAKGKIEELIHMQFREDLRKHPQYVAEFNAKGSIKAYLDRLILTSRLIFDWGVKDQEKETIRTNLKQMKIIDCDEDCYTYHYK